MISTFLVMLQMRCSVKETDMNDLKNAFFESIVFSCSVLDMSDDI